MRGGDFKRREMMMGGGKGRADVEEWRKAGMATQGVGVWSMSERAE